MPDAPHGVKVETQVVDRIEDLSQDFVRCINMSQIGPRIAPAHSACTVWIERAGITSVSRLLDRDFAIRCVQQAMPGGSGGKHAVHHVYAQGGVFSNFLRRSD